MEAWVSTKRVQQFLQLEEVDWTHYYVGYNGTSRAESRNGETWLALIVVPVIIAYLLPLDSYQNAEVGSSATALCMYDGIFSWKGCDNQAAEEGGVKREGEGEGDKGRDKKEREEHERSPQWTLSNISLNLPTVSWGWTWNTYTYVCTCIKCIHQSCFCWRWQTIASLNVCVISKLLECTVHVHVHTILYCMSVCTLYLLRVSYWEWQGRWDQERALYWQPSLQRWGEYKDRCFLSHTFIFMACACTYILCRFLLTI